MSAKSIRLIDATGHALACGEVADRGEFYAGTIDLTCTPPKVRELFTEFEAIVNGQEFSCLDEIQQRNDALHATVVFLDGDRAPVTDLQVYPSAGTVSFRVAEVTVPIARD
jgi:hypothetical protein